MSACLLDGSGHLPALAGKASNAQRWAWGALRREEQAARGELRGLPLDGREVVGERRARHDLAVVRPRRVKAVDGRPDGQDVVHDRVDAQAMQVLHLRRAHRRHATACACSCACRRSLLRGAAVCQGTGKHALECGSPTAQGLGRPHTCASATRQSTPAAACLPRAIASGRAPPWPALARGPSTTSRPQLRFEQDTTAVPSREDALTPVQQKERFKATAVLRLLHARDRCVVLSHITTRDADCRQPQGKRAKTNSASRLSPPKRTAWRHVAVLLCHGVTTTAATTASATLGLRKIGIP